jgi:hypothetical protein
LRVRTFVEAAACAFLAASCGTSTGSGTADVDAATPDANGAAVDAGSLGPPPPLGECRTTADCTLLRGEECSLSYSTCGGPVYPAQCTSDAECAADGGAASICDRPPNGCAVVCFEGCTSDAQCPVAEVCTGTVTVSGFGPHRCMPKPCATPNDDCGGPNYACDPASNGYFCGAKPCRSDADCEGHCVWPFGTSTLYTGQCSAGFGICEIPPG